MKVGSLFSGGGLGDYGLELAGMEIAFQVEIDDYCQKVLNLRWPNVPKWKDIREVKGSELPAVDLISGGFPCQDISVAGKGIGIEGQKSGLWKEMFRLVCEIRPRYVLVENSPALLGRGIGIVLSDLARIGYDAEWDCLPASAFGAPHLRYRTFILAYPFGFGGDERFLQDRESDKKRRETRMGEFGGVAGPKTWIETVSNDVRADDGAPHRMERLTLLGNGQVVQVVQWIGERIMQYEQL